MGRAEQPHHGILEAVPGFNGQALLILVLEPQGWRDHRCQSLDLLDIGLVEGLARVPLQGQGADNLVPFTEGHATDRALAHVPGQLHVGMVDGCRARVGARIDDDPVLVDRLIHGSADRLDQVGFMFEAGTVG